MRNFLGVVYFSLFNKNTPRLFESTLSLVTTMSDWYYIDFFTYFRIWGSKTIHLLPRIVPNRMELAKIVFQIVVDGVHSQIYVTKRGPWPKIPSYIVYLVI